MQEDLLRPTAVADTGDHRCVILLIREDDAAGKKLRQCRQRRFVGDECRGEKKCCILAVEVGKLVLEFDVIMGRACDVTGAARAGADEIDRLVHGGKDLGMLAHAKIVVRAPYRDGLGRLALQRRRPSGTRPGDASHQRKPGTGPRA